MLDHSTFAAFVTASILLVIAPGPGQALTLANTLSRGPRAGLLTAVGLNLGTLVHAGAASMGLSAVIASSAVAFSAVKYAGAAYLVYLGVSLALTWTPCDACVKAAARPRTTSPLVQGALAGLLNPKVAVFFLAFLPQFVEPARGQVPLQLFLLGMTMALLDTAYEAVLVWAACRTRRRIAARPRFRRVQQRVTGSVLVLLGLRMASLER